MCVFAWAARCCAIKGASYGNTAGIKCFGDNGADYKKSTYELGVADNENHDKHTGLVRSFGSHFNRIVL